jgi:hypothetical protein
MKDCPVSSVRVGPYTYALAWQNSNWRVEVGAPAQASMATREIRVACEDRQSSDIADDLMHEITHTLHDMFGSDKDVIEAEQVAWVAGVGLTMFWQDNPEFCAWWVELAQGGAK